eukprot:TRINITY_DN14258_c0_g2_i1.p1 TRINITY_DN14258_c0_g2~~TRINITY_DN14258_c0_g2_i1.p1  ORF type:complete len:328 (-),score=109.48 TRINITY_DN14258_c0_g2_i1:34-1017(-)
MDLRRRFKVMAQEKEDYESSFKYPKSNPELQNLEARLASKQRRIRDADSELRQLSTTMNDKEKELKELRQMQAAREADHLIWVQENRAIENELAKLKRQEMSNQFNKEGVGMHAREAEEEVESIRQKVKELESRLERAKQPKTRPESKIHDKEANELAEANMKLETDICALVEKAASMEDKLKKTKETFSSNSLLLDSYYKELRQLNATLRNSSVRTIESKKQLKEFKGKNAVLKHSLEEQKKDAEVQKQQCEETCEQKILLELDRRKLEREKMSSEVVVKMTGEELKKAKEMHTKLLEDKIQAHEELNALMPVSYTHLTLPTICSV